MTGRVVKEGEYLLRKYEALSSNLNSARKKEKRLRLKY
jgi:hypothetical protein